MATPSSSSPLEKEDPGNHPVSSTMGGASAYPTPANNVGGGSGWGDEGFWKGGHHGPGHKNAPNAKATIGEFLGLTQQKNVAGSKNDERYDQVAGGAEDSNSVSGEPTCQSEDHSFMGHRPGCPQTLPGWTKTKNLVEMIHGQGR